MEVLTEPFTKPKSLSSLSLVAVVVTERRGILLVVIERRRAKSLSSTGWKAGQVVAERQRKRRVRRMNRMGDESVIRVGCSRLDSGNGN